MISLNKRNSRLLRMPVKLGRTQCEFYLSLNILVHEGILPSIVCDAMYSNEGERIRILLHPFAEAFFSFCRERKLLIYLGGWSICKILRAFFTHCNVW